MIRSEDRPRTLVYVEILGFKAIAESYHFRVQDSGPDEQGFLHSWATELQNRSNRFDRVLDQCVFNETLNGGMQVLLFSDCAFLVFETSLQAAVVSTRLMRDFIKEKVPVRMGLGKGTFYDIEYVTRTNADPVLVSKSRFIGTAVVRAHAAEQCGGKGMRVFLDASLEGDLTSIRQQIKVLQLTRPLRNAKWELDYLNESRPASENEAVEKADHDLFESIANLKDPKLPPNVRRHYTQTLAAMNRMRKVNSRKTISFRNLMRAAPDGSSEQPRRP